MGTSGRGRAGRRDRPGRRGRGGTMRCAPGTTHRHPRAHRPDPPDVRAAHRADLGRAGRRGPLRRRPPGRAGRPLPTGRAGRGRRPVGLRPPVLARSVPRVPRRADRGRHRHRAGRARLLRDPTAPPAGGRSGQAGRHPPDPQPRSADPRRGCGEPPRRVRTGRRGLPLAGPRPRHGDRRAPPLVAVRARRQPRRHRIERPDAALPAAARPRPRPGVGGRIVGGRVAAGRPPGRRLDAPVPERRPVRRRRRAADQGGRRRRTTPGVGHPGHGALRLARRRPRPGRGPGHRLDGFPLRPAPQGVRAPPGGRHRRRGGGARGRVPRRRARHVAVYVTDDEPIDQFTRLLEALPAAGVPTGR